jgi:molybdopterin synthase sulfur carrier subunit
MKILYFSWLRERIGVPSENIETSALTVNELLSELILSDIKYEEAFSNRVSLRVAIDQELANDFSASIVGASEIAFFPPMTGG